MLIKKSNDSFNVIALRYAVMEEGECPIKMRVGNSKLGE